jgi:hypothetical protein
MTQTQINNGIAYAFLWLEELNPDLYGYWVNTLYTVKGDFVEHMWNQATLAKMGEDIMYHFESLQSA